MNTAEQNTKKGMEESDVIKQFMELLSQQNEDAVTDILTGKRFELDVLDYMKIEGDMSEDLEAKLWEKRMPNLTPAEQLAVEIDRFIYNYDTNVYHDNNQTMTENVSEISEMIGKGDVEHLTE